VKFGIYLKFSEAKVTVSTCPLLFININIPASTNVSKNSQLYSFTLLGLSGSISPSKYLLKIVFKYDPFLILPKSK